MSLYPSVQRSVQDEIDDVIGDARLPSNDDLGKLHKLEAVLKEVLRFAPIAPLGKLILPEYCVSHIDACVYSLAT